MLASDLESPVVSESSVGSGLFHSLEILSKLGVQIVGYQLRVTAVLEVVSPVQEPEGDAVALRVRDDVLDGLAVLFGQLTSPAIRRYWAFYLILGLTLAIFRMTNENLLPKPLIYLMP